MKTDRRPRNRAGTHAAGARRLAGVSACAAAALVAGVVRGRGRARADRESTGPGHRGERWEHPEETGARQAEDFGGEDERLTPHELKGYGNLGTRPAPPGKDDRNDGNDTGAFGSGGPGA